MFQKKALVVGNMKILSVIALGVLALCLVTFQSVNSLPKIKPLKPTPPPFDWTQFLPPGAGPAASKRAVAGDDPSAASDGAYGAVSPKLAANPMAPYLALKPFLPVKPTFVPPFVDPNLFVGKKAELLSNLFGSGVGPAAGTPSFIPPWISGGVIAAPSFFAEKKTTLLGTTFDPSVTDSSSLDAKRELAEEEPVSHERRLVVGPPSLWGPPAGVIPTPKPTIVPPGYWAPAPAAGPVPPVVDPSVMLDKKTAFLNTLFSSLSAPSGAPVSARAVVPDDADADATAEPTVKPTIVPPSFWLQFIPGYAAAAATTPAPTPKPTIVPPGFWIPSLTTKPVGLFGPPVPVVDPKEILDKKAAFLSTLFSTLNISVTPAPVTTPAPTLDPVTAYQEKVAEFLDKLFEAIVNDTDDSSAAKRALDPVDKAKTSEDLKAFLGQIEAVEENAEKLESELETRGAQYARRSADVANDTTSAPQLPVDALLTAKDKVVDTIIAEMGGIKNNILDTLAELLAKQKEAAATPPPTPAPKKKPGPPFGPGGPFGAGPFGAGPFGAWGVTTTTTPKPTPDPEPFQKKVEFLGQVFDTLTQLEKDVTDALNQAVSEAAQVSAASTAATPTTPETKPAAKNGTTLIELLRSKLIELANSSDTEQGPKYARAIVGKPVALPSPAPTIVDPSFWVPDPAGGIPGPDFYLGKTQSFLSKLFASKAATSAATDDGTGASKARSIKMAVHQGYQSLPPGSEELLQAGGGSTPEKHEGGGLKLQAEEAASPAVSEGGPSRHRHHDHHNRD